MTMQVSTGLIFASYDSAVMAGVPAEDLVEITGTSEQVETIAAAVRAGITAKERAARKAKNKAAKKSRRANR
jgi:hypothetical protein